MKKCLLLFVALISFGAQSQSKDVKYIKLKQTYDFQSEPNEYRLNSALKQKLENLGYIIYFDDDMPQEVRLDPCAEYIATLSRGKGSLTTNLNLEIKDCKGKIIFSKEGESRLKVHRKSYMDAFQNIFKYSNVEMLRKK